MGAPEGRRTAEKTGTGEDIDAKSEDHAYDAIGNILLSRAPQIEERDDAPVPEGVHPGFSKRGKRRGSGDGSATEQFERAMARDRAQGRDPMQGKRTKLNELVEEME